MDSMDRMDEATRTSLGREGHSLANVLQNIKTFPLLPHQERRVVLRELVALCDHSDLQVLQRLLGQTTHSGYDPVSILPAEISHTIFLYLEGMDLVRCLAVCRPWREMIQANSALWRAKVLAWDPAECVLLKDESNLVLFPLDASDEEGDEGTDTDTDTDTGTDTDSCKAKDNNNANGHPHAIKDAAMAVAMVGKTLDKIAKTPGFKGWEAILVRELALQQNWYRGRYTYEMTLTLNRNIKCVLLNWPILTVVDDSSRVFSIDLFKVRQDRYTAIPVGDTKYTNLFQPQAYGAVSCVAWDSTGHSSAQNQIRHRGKAGASGATLNGTSDAAEVDLEEEPSYSLALGGYFRSIQMCDPVAGKSIVLPEVLHGFPLHIVFMQDQVLSVTLDGLITYFRKGLDYRPVRSSTVDTKVIQVAVVSFGSGVYEHNVGGTNATVFWKEAACFAHEGGVIIKDEHARSLCRIHLELGARLLQIQAIVDGTPPYRNEILILYEEPLTRQRVVLTVEMEPGFRKEKARIPCPHTVSAATLGRGGDARDSIAMYRDRIAIVSHRNCSSGLGHYCTLRLIDTRENRVLSTEFVSKKSTSTTSSLSSRLGCDSDSSEEGDEEEEEAEEEEREEEDMVEEDRHGHVDAEEEDGSDNEEQEGRLRETLETNRGQGGEEIKRRDTSPHPGGPRLQQSQQQQQHSKHNHHHHHQHQHHHHHRPRKNQTWIQKRGKSISLSDLADINKSACRILAMDHARIVLGMGPRIIKILCLV